MYFNLKGQRRRRGQGRDQGARSHTDRKVVCLFPFRRHILSTDTHIWFWFLFLSVNDISRMLRGLQVNVPAPCSSCQPKKGGLAVSEMCLAASKIRQVFQPTSLLLPARCFSSYTEIRANHPFLTVQDLSPLVLQSVSRTLAGKELSTYQHAIVPVLVKEQHPRLQSDYNLLIRPILLARVLIGVEHGLSTLASRGRRCEVEKQSPGCSRKRRYRIRGNCQRIRLIVFGQHCQPPRCRS
jgi:hypothetical protein